MNRSQPPDPPDGKGAPPAIPEAGVKTTASGPLPRPQIVEMPLPSGFRFRLRQLNGRDAGRLIELSRARQTLGRSDADVVIEDGSISRKHAAIEIYDIDFVYLKDLASTNGTFLNGEMINAAKLRAGDTVGVGDCKLEFLVEALAVQP